MTPRHRLAAILIFSITSVCVKSCEVNDVAVYKFKLEVLNGGLIENHEVHFSEVFGQSHNHSYALYHLDEPSSLALHSFIQTGNLDQLVEFGNEEPKVYDQVTAPAEGLLFLDGEHSLVSLISRIMPPNGWFIGIDSLALCLHSSWVEEITLDLEVLDANIGNVDEVIKSVEKVSKNNFGYNNKDKSYYQHVHPIAKVAFLKIQAYSSKEINDISRKEILKTKSNKIFKNKLKRINTDYAYTDDITTKNSVEQLENLEEDPVGTPKPNNPENNVVVITEAPSFIDSQSEEPPDVGSMDEAVLAVANGKKLGLGKHLPRHFRSRLHHAVNRRHGKDCIVSKWSDWSPCPDPCSTKQRVREVVQTNIGRGRPCPTLVQKQPCGRCVRGDGDYIW